MIFDLRQRPEHVHRYQILDAETGQPLDRPVFYADDATGLCLAFVGAADHHYRPDPETGAVPIEAFHRAVRIVRREPT